MSLTKEQQNMAAVGIVAAVAVGFFIFKILMPMNLRIDSKIQELTKTYNEIKSLDDKAKQLELLKRQNELLTEELRLTEKKLPTKEELANLLRYINETTQISNIYVQSFRPLSREKKQYYETIPFGFDVSTSYHNLAQFINTINQTERIITVKDLVINSSSGEVGSVETLRANFNIATYMIK